MYYYTDQSKGFNENKYWRKEEATAKLKYISLKPDIGKHPLGCSRHLYRARLINYRAIQTPCEGVKDLAAGERLGRKFTCAPFIPHGRGLIKFSNENMKNSSIKENNSRDWWFNWLKMKGIPPDYDQQTSRTFTLYYSNWGNSLSTWYVIQL